MSFSNQEKHKKTAKVQREEFKNFEQIQRTVSNYFKVKNFTLIALLLQFLLSYL